MCKDMIYKNLIVITLIWMHTLYSYSNNNDNNNNNNINNNNNNEQLHYYYYYMVIKQIIVSNYILRVLSIHKVINSLNTL